MNEPLASAAGNAVEVAQRRRFPDRARRDRRLEEVTLALAAEMLRRPASPRSNQEGSRAPPRRLTAARAAEASQRMVAALGGPADFVDRPRKIPAQGTGGTGRDGASKTVLSPASRRATSALPWSALGGGRTRPDDRIDHAVGITRLLPVGAEVPAASRWRWSMPGQTADAEAAAAAVLAAYTIGASKPAAEKAVIRRILPRG